MFGIGTKKKASLQSIVDKQQKTHLKQFKAEQRAKAKEEARRKKVTSLKARTELYRARMAERKAKQRAHKQSVKHGLYLSVPKPSIPLLTTGIKKKAQNKTLSRKSRIRLI